jgi:alpha-tubulin suppressor-like RCC1 family protein
MSERWPGGIISKTPPTVTPPVDGEGGSASGLWSLAEVLDYEKAGAWPKPVLPRELYAWGLGTSGQLGQNDVISRSSPVQIGQLGDWSDVSAGRNHSVSIKTDGTLWNWGCGFYGQLGNGTITSRSSPIQVGALTDWVQISTVRDHNIALKSNGTIWTWGRNNFGQIGDSTVANKSSPIQVGALTTWAKVSAGGYHSAAIKTDGTLWTWGRNYYGQLGTNTIFNVGRSSPVQVGALTTWAKVSANKDNTAAIRTNGTLWTWGRSNYGQIGDSSVTNRSSPVQIGALTDWSQITMAPYGNMAAIKNNGTLWTWGANFSGQLGDNTQTARSSPVQVGALTNWAQISANFQHVASVKTDGTLWTWGLNTNGRLGDGTVVSKSSPIQIGSLTNWLQASAGETHTLALFQGTTN